ncbi:M24 family metallopeptidase [Thioclava sp. FR2]|uniref:M24 family metallopeptidase n=1 Tax=Thioclava sp. FR2 TaxID=3445780 RepID=UPI003EB74C8F
MAEERSLIFPAQEYRARVARLQAKMAANAQDALLLTSAADIFYVTGFLTRFWESPARPWFIIIPANGDPVAVIPSIGADLMGKTWMTTIRTWPAPVPGDDGLSLLAETLADMVPATGSIALPMGLETHLRMPLADYLTLTTRLAPRRFVDGTDTVQRVREIKSKAEVVKIRAACAIADRAYARVPEFAATGRPLNQIFRDFQRVLLEEGADWVSYVAGGAGQGGYGDVISPATDQPLQTGDVLMLDTGAVRDGYFCDFDRNYAVGPVSAQTHRAQAALHVATDRALATLRPGMLARDAHRILSDELARHGFADAGGRLGHGLGITLTEWPSFTPLDTTELVEGMVLTLEPGAVVEGGTILVHEENIVLRANGPELLSTRAPRDLPQLD